jgi:putative DNA primase/helicase
MMANGRWWSEADDGQLLLHLQNDTEMKCIPMGKVQTAVRAFAGKHSRNSAREYFESLEWDRTPRIETFFIRACGAKDTEYERAVGRNFWRSMMARVFKPGCQADNMVVLEGEQGIRKSTMCDIIGGEWFASTQELPTKKDFYQIIQGKLLVELCEMFAVRKVEQDAIKGAISRPVDTFRVPWDIYPGKHPRQCILIGTTNEYQWAQDDTGNRRYWPIRCSGMIDTEYVSANREQLFAEAVFDVCKRGASWHEVPETATKAEQAQRFRPEPWRQLIEKHLEGGKLNSGVQLNFLLEHACGVARERLTSGNHRRAAKIMRDLGWTEPQDHKSSMWTKGV